MVEIESNRESNIRDEQDKKIKDKIEEISEELIEEDIKPPVNNKKDINDGFCMHIAEEVANSVDADGIRLMQSGGMGYSHTWIERYGLHFDAESPNGVYDYRELKMWDRFGTPAWTPDIVEE
jgi:hypothetical protein